MSNPTTPFSWQMPTATDLVTDLPADFEVFGQAVATSLADLLGGTSGQVLAKNSNTDMDFVWVTSDDANAIQNTIVDAKGDLIAASAADTPARLAVGNNGETLVADSSTSTGLRYNANFSAGKNKVINGDFGIWQRGTSFSADGYTADRFAMRLSGATATTTRQSFTVGQTDVPNNPTYFARLAVTTGDNSCRLETLLEDVVLSSGQTFTLSFWAKGTNPAGGSMEIFSRQEFGAGGSTAVATSQGTITLTASWQRFTKTFTYASVSGKTIVANNSYGFDIRQPGADTGVAAWTLDIANVQLEIGSVATAFQTATGNLQAELAACQRYYYRQTADATAVYAHLGQSRGDGATSAVGQTVLPVTMRVTPTSVDYSTVAVTDGAAVYAATAVALASNQNDAKFAAYTMTFASGVTQFRYYYVVSNNSATGYLGFSAEL